MIEQTFLTYFLIPIILKYIERDIENNSLTFKQDNLINVPVTWGYSKVTLIQDIHVCTDIMSFIVPASVAK